MDAEIESLTKREVEALAKRLDNIADSIEEIKDRLAKRDTDIEMLNFRVANLETDLIMAKKEIKDLKEVPNKKNSRIVDSIFTWISRGVGAFLMAAILYYLQHPQI